MPQSETKPEVADMAAEEEVTYLSKRHRVSPAIVREIIRRTGTTECSAFEREVRKGMARR